MLFPNVWHRYQPDPVQGWQEYWLGFQGTLMQDWVKKNCLPNRDVFPEIGQNSRMVTLFQKILKYVQDNPHGVQQIVTGFAMEISEEHTSEHKSLSTNSYVIFFLKHN